MQAVLNESFKALVEKALPDKAQSEVMIKAFVEVVNDRATTHSLGLDDLKNKAINEVKNEFVTKDFLRAEIAEVRAEIAEVRAEMAQMREELRAEMAKTKVEILKWVFAMQLSTIIIIIGALKFILN